MISKENKIVAPVRKKSKTALAAAFIHCCELENFSYPASCPFNVTRLSKLHELLESKKLLDAANISQIAPQRADRMALKKFHTAKYLFALKEASKGRIDATAYRMGIDTPDCPAFADMYDYGIWSTGATLKAAELILEGKAQVAFNPSGGLHHAFPEKAAGFCYINDNAIVCKTLADAGKKVLYLDIDVHHGDGVQQAVYDRRDVMTISFHQSGKTLFPGTGFPEEIGTGAGKGYSVNVPLPIGTFDSAYLKAFGAIAFPLMKSYEPDIFVLELGADALAGDPLANLQLTNNTYGDIIKLLLSFDKPILMTGGGGYNIENTVRAWAYSWVVLTGQEQKAKDLKDEENIPSEQQFKMVDQAIDHVIEDVKKNVFGYHGL